MMFARAGSSMATSFKLCIFDQVQVVDRPAAAAAAAE